MSAEEVPPSWGRSSAPPATMTVAGLIARLARHPGHMPVAVGWPVWNWDAWSYLDSPWVQVEPETSEWSDDRPDRTRVVVFAEVDPSADSLCLDPSRWGLTAEEIATGPTVDRDGQPVKLRLSGTAQECAAVVELLGAVLDLVEVSAPYPNRGASQLVRVYLEARLLDETGNRSGSRRS